MLEQGLEDIENGVLLQLRQENDQLNGQLTDLRTESIKTKQLQERIENHKSTFNEVISQKDMQIEALTKSLTQQIGQVEAENGELLKQVESLTLDKIRAERRIEQISQEFQVVASDREQLESDINAIVNERDQLMETLKAQLELKEAENVALKRQIESFGSSQDDNEDGNPIPYHQRAKNFIFGML